MQQQLTSLFKLIQHPTQKNFTVQQMFLFFFKTVISTNFSNPTKKSKLVAQSHQIIDHLVVYFGLKIQNWFNWFISSQPTALHLLHLFFTAIYIKTDLFHHSHLL